MLSPIQFVRLDNGMHVAASEISTAVPSAAGGFDLTFKNGLPPAHAADLSGLGDVRPAKRGAEGYCNGEMRSIYAWRVCPFTSTAHPVWGLPYVRLPINFGAAFASKT